MNHEIRIPIKRLGFPMESNRLVSWLSCPPVVPYPTAWHITQLSRDENRRPLRIPMNQSLGGGFKQFLCSSLFGEMIQFDSYFSDGLKPPTRFPWANQDFMEGTSRELPGTAAWNFQNGLSGFPSFRENPCSLSCGCQTPLKTTFWLAWDSLGVGWWFFCFKIVCSGNDPILRSTFFRWVVSSPPRCFFLCKSFQIPWNELFITNYIVWN